MGCVWTIQHVFERQLQRIHIASWMCILHSEETQNILAGCRFCGYFGAANWKNIANTPAAIACDTQLNAEQFKSLKINAKLYIQRN